MVVLKIYIMWPVLKEMCYWDLPKRHFVARMTKVGRRKYNNRQDSQSPPNWPQIRTPNPDSHSPDPSFQYIGH